MYTTTIKHVSYSYVFVGLRSLDSLGLAHNKLKEVPARVFSHLTLLNSLELDGNSITFVDPEAFYGVEGKKELFIIILSFYYYYY